jgi:hypothetical protein
VTPDRDHDRAALEPGVTSVTLADVARGIRRYQVLAADDDAGTGS